jgi:hypothetical protein
MIPNMIDPEFQTGLTEDLLVVDCRDVFLAQTGVIVSEYLSVFKASALGCLGDRAPPSALPLFPL